MKKFYQRNKIETDTKEFQDQLRVLHQILSIGNVIYSIPVNLKLCQFLYSGLKSIKGVETCIICLFSLGKAFGDTLENTCPQCEFFGTQKLCANQDIIDDSIHVFSLNTDLAQYAYITLKTNASFSVSLVPAIQNLANIAAIVIENNNQRLDLETKNEELNFHRDQLEQKVQERTIDLVNAKERAEESDKLKTAFLNNISHEFRTPMNGIIGFSQLLTKKDLPDEKRNSLSESLAVSCERLLGIVTLSVEMSEIQSKQLNFNESLASMDKILKQVQEELAYQINKKDLKVIIKNDVDFPFSTDSKKLIKIINYLTDNAIKFTEYGSVEISCKSLQDYIQITIKDTGIGIAPEMQKIIFESYRQVETGLCRNYGGNGLGLSIVKAYVELLGGKIHLDSAIGKGTTIIVTLPIKPENKVLISQTMDLENINWSDKTVLIAEDEFSNYMVLEAFLEETRIKIHYSKNGKEAVDYCKGNNIVDLILMDIKMPEMDGITATKIIKGLRGSVPIIAQTGYALSNEIEQYLIEDFNGYLTKPIKQKDLLTIIGQNLKSSKHK